MIMSNQALELTAAGRFGSQRTHTEDVVVPVAGPSPAAVAQLGR